MKIPPRDPLQGMGDVMPMAGYFLIEYIPDDDRGMPAHLDKMPLVGFAFAQLKITDWSSLFPLTLRGIYIHEKNNPPTILCPCGGVLHKDIFFDCLDDYMQAMAYKHAYDKENIPWD
jgi:hypothetical protein